MSQPPLDEWDVGAGNYVTVTKICFYDLGIMLLIMVVLTNSPMVLPTLRPGSRVPEPGAPGPEVRVPHHRRPHHQLGQGQPDVAYHSANMSVQWKPEFSLVKAANAFRAVEQYAANLVSQPWRWDRSVEYSCTVEYSTVVQYSCTVEYSAVQLYSTVVQLSTLSVVWGEHNVYSLYSSGKSSGTYGSTRASTSTRWRRHSRGQTNSSKVLHCTLLEDCQLCLQCSNGLKTLYWLN